MNDDELRWQKLRLRIHHNLHMDDHRDRELLDRLIVAPIVDERSGSPQPVRVNDETYAEVYIDVVITSAHRLPHVGPDHRCRAMHGHDFRIRIVVRGRINPDSEAARIVQPGEVGMVTDYDRVLRMWQTLHDQLDHVILNEVPGLENPTCENLALWILRRTPDWVCRVEVSTTIAGGQGGCVVRRVDLADDP